MLKKYLVFGGECCYPNGGFGDFMTSFDSKQEAISRSGKPTKERRFR